MCDDALAYVQSGAAEYDGFATGYCEYGVNKVLNYMHSKYSCVIAPAGSVPAAANDGANIAGTGLTASSTDTYSNAPNGSVTIFQADPAGGPYHYKASGARTGGSLYGHIEIACTTSSGTREYLSDYATTTQPAGSVSGNPSTTYVTH